MIESTGATVKREDRSPNIPRAVIHKKILDTAESRPSDSIVELTESISGASAQLVEQVLEEYGDPAEDGRSPSKEPTPEPISDMSTNTESTTHENESGEGIEDQMTVSTNFDIGGDLLSSKDTADITDRQWEILRAIEQHPDATQGELGEILGVTGATICSCVNSIDGFNWNTRQAFVETVIENEKMTPPVTDEKTVPGGDTSATDDGVEDRIAELAVQVEAIDERLDERSNPADSIFTDPTLAHKVVHACMQSDSLTEEEELQVLHELLSQ